MKKIANYINGKHVPPNSRNYIDNYDPSIGKIYSLIPDSDVSDVEAAVAAAKKAFPKWSSCGTQERYRIMNKMADLIAEKKEILAQAESRDSGKAISLSRAVDIPRAEANIRFFATAILHFSSSSHQMEGVAINYTLRQAIGVVGCISPWNLPLYLFTWKIAPALATGNCVIAKPSEITPMTAYLLSEIAIEAGMPPGVLNILHGLGPKVGQGIVEHPGIKAISFTGGTATGRILARTAAPMFKKLSLELGGKNPNVIFADCDFEEAIKTTMRSSFANNGQICLCGSRVYIERPIYEKFRGELVRRAKALKVGDPFADDTVQGSLVSKQHREKVMGYLELAKEEGGTILCGGEPISPGGDLDGGYYLSPAVVEALPNHCRTNQEEIFGPVVTLQPFDTEEEALALANGVQYGLASTIWTSNIQRATRMAEKIEAGIVWINCWLLRDLRTPFGGVKNSGVGREGGTEALRFFTEAKNVCVKY